jgi:hypothetical protein
LLAQKKRNKEKGSHRSFSGEPFFQLHTHYNSPDGGTKSATDEYFCPCRDQTVMLPAAPPFAASKWLSQSEKALKAIFIDMIKFRSNLSVLRSKAIKSSPSQPQNGSLNPKKLKRLLVKI